MKIREEITCPLEITHDIIRGKWKTVILYQINYYGKVSLSTLNKDIRGISEKMLLEQLSELREFGLVDKVQYEGYPLKVEYYLTDDKGKKIIKALDIMQEIGREYLEERSKNARTN